METEKKPKTKQQYSRNVKILKVKLRQLHAEVEAMQNKVDNAKRTSNDKVIALKLLKFCKERKLTTEKIFRFADANRQGEVDQDTFKNTLIYLGFKFTQDELSKMIMVIDENISGRIRIKDYYDYLSAFNIRCQPHDDEQQKNIQNSLFYIFVGGLEKLNQKLISETLGINLDEFIPVKQPTGSKSETNDTDDQDRHKANRMIDYEQYYRYCKKNFPELSDKELIGIFNRLDYEGSGKISLQDLLLFLKERKQADEELKKKNKKTEEENKKRRQSNQSNNESSINNNSKKKQENNTKPRPQNQKSLESSISLIINERTKQGIFQMQELQQKFPSKQEAMDLFYKLDYSRANQFTYNDILRYYVENKTVPSYIFAYTIIEAKLSDRKQTIEEFLFDNGLKEDSELTQELFKNIMGKQFGLSDADTRLMYAELKKQIVAPRPVLARDLVTIVKKAREQAPGKQKPTRLLVDLNNIVTLNYFGTRASDFFRKNLGTIVKNPMVALKFCVQLEGRLKKQFKTKWSDYEFGPKLQDPYGKQSIGQMRPGVFEDQQEIYWKRASQMPFDSFYNPKEYPIYQKSRLNDAGLLNALDILSTCSQDFLLEDFARPKNLNKLTDAELAPAFRGLRPPIFNEFSKYGIYVFRFFVEDSWVFVIVDDIIPVVLQKGTEKYVPLFSSSGTGKSSWVPLVEKAYAKLKGCYMNLLDQQDTFQVLYELGHYIPKAVVLPSSNEQDREILNDNWKEVSQLFSDRKNQTLPKVHCMNSKAGYASLVVDDEETGLTGNRPVPVHYVVNLPDSQAKNHHKSHWLYLLKIPESWKILDFKWNPEWSRNLPDNKIAEFEDEIEDEFKKNKQYNIKVSKLLVVEDNLARKIFDTVLDLEDPSLQWQGVRSKDTLELINGEYIAQYRVKLEDTSPLLVCLNNLGQSVIDYSILLKYYPYDSKNNTPEIKSVISQRKSVNVLWKQRLQPKQYLVSIRSREKVTFSTSFYFKTYRYKVQRERGASSQWQDIKEVEKQNYNVDGVDENTRDFLNKRVFNVVPPQRKCC